MVIQYVSRPRFVNGVRWPDMHCDEEQRRHDSCGMLPVELKFLCFFPNASSPPSFSSRDEIFP